MTPMLSHASGPLPQHGSVVIVLRSHVPMGAITRLGCVCVCALAMGGCARKRIDAIQADRQPVDAALVTSDMADTPDASAVFVEGFVARGADGADGGDSAPRIET